MAQNGKKKDPLSPPIKHPPDFFGLNSSSSNTASTVMVKRAILSAQKHGIAIKHGSPNSANGNCAFESAIFNVNDRECFLENLPMSVDYYRRIWMTDMKNRTIDDPTWNIYTTTEWDSGWAEMMESGVYERGIFGDLMLFGIACGIRKVFLIFNTSLESPHDPIFVCDPRKFGVEPDTDTPLLLAYNLSHYESMHPVSENDTEETKRLVSDYLGGRYKFGKKDLPHLLCYTGEEASQTLQSEEGSKLKDFQMKLPEHLRGKRPRDMDKDEKKEYNSFRTKLSRANAKEQELKANRERNEDYENANMENEESKKDNNRISKQKEPAKIPCKDNLQSELPEHLKGMKPRDMNDQEKKEYNNLKSNLSRAKKGKNETKEEAQKRKEKEKDAKSNKRKNETEEESQKRKEKQNESKSEKRKNETEDEAKQRKETRNDKINKQTEDEHKKRKNKEAHAKQLQRAEHIPKSNYLARNALQVLAGEQLVAELKNTKNSCGKMDVICKFCGAKKWKKETASLCCNSGKVELTPYPSPPVFIKNLLTENSTEAKLFRENSRSFNNALALSSIRVNEKKFSNGYNPSVIFEGKVQQLYGPLLPENGEDPKFAQLYIHDPSTQHTIRVKNMCLPDSLSKQHVEIITETLQKLQSLIKEVNPFVKDFLHICEVPDSEITDGKLIISCRKEDRPKESHERRYNLQQSFNEVSVLTNSVPGDLVLRKRGGGLQFIYDLHPSAQPLHFVLLFPFGTPGYSEFLKHQDKNKSKRVSPREFFAYHLNLRDLDSDFLFGFTRLFQEFLCLAFTTIENQKLKFQKNNQNALRADTYKNVKDALSDRVPIGDRISKDDHQLKIGKRIVLSKSFVGSPRWYHSKFQDGMAICRKYHKPDFFITFTCNPNWTEITDELRQFETVQNRPDLVSRVFKLKKDELLKDITGGQILGKVPAFMWVIEFQKRGLPHAHILVILSEDDRVTSGTDVDNIISAQLPPDPELFPPGSPEREQAQRLESIVLKNMVHGPCGKLNPSSPCMVDGKCSKNYPKKFCDKTVINAENTYPEYQRLSPENGGRSITRIVKGKEYTLDNRWIVPYSPFLCLKFNCHTNNELCVSPIASKYLFKYVTKGEDRAMVRTEIDDNGESVKNEIDEYIDLRSVGSSEASWHIFNFNISKNYPAVYALRVHMEDEQHVVFDMETAEQMVETQRSTELTAFFDYNLNNPETQVSYVDFPEHFVLKDKEWVARKRKSDTIGRVHAVNPVAGDLYYLRMLLHHDHCKGKMSFDDIRTVDGSLHESYQEVCRKLGLLQDDREWDEALNEGSATKMSSALRELFITIILFCMPSNPQELFDMHCLEWADDFIYEARNNGVVLTESQIRTMVLLDIQQRLHSWERELRSFRISEPTAEEMEAVSFSKGSALPVLMKEELEFETDEMLELVNDRKNKFTQSQKEVFDTVIEGSNKKESVCIFIDARGGTGKTFVLNAILAAVRIIDGGSVALAVGSTGIAANLLLLGRTFHSRFKIPLNIDKDSVCNINAQSSLADLICKTKIIVWDEAPMGHKYQLEALDRSLRDITGSEKPFGDKSIVLSGDFRQCLAVIPHANRAEVVDACLNRSYLWQHFKVMQLTENMRVMLSGDPEALAFDEFTLKLGNGNIETISGTDLVSIPEEMCMEITPNSQARPNGEKESMKKLADFVYPELKLNLQTKGWMKGRAILAPTNNQVNQINDILADMLPGDPVVLLSSDDLINPNDFQRYNTEYLNTLSPNGLPHHRIFLKTGMPLMLMRNLNPKMGLCNGTRLIFNRVLKNHLLDCTIVGSAHEGRKVLIPRITLKPKDREFPFEWCRRQFPVRVSFAMTINKSQGQTLQNVGVWLSDTCFGHGQLYVAISRVGSVKHIKFAIRKIEGQHWNQTSNVVYKEVLLKGNI